MTLRSHTVSARKSTLIEAQLKDVDGDVKLYKGVGACSRRRLRRPRRF